MVLGRLLQSLVNNARLVEKLSETQPIRQAARITVSLASRLELGGREAAERLRRSGAVRKLWERIALPRQLGGLSQWAARLRDSWARELKEGPREAPGHKKQK
ncbi:protein NCBP2AS2-like [Mustelus asterias]